MTLRLILGDQLNLKHSWFEKQDDNTIYVLYELYQEANYVVHHIQKLVAFFSAMRAFASDLQNKGNQDLYFDSFLQMQLFHHHPLQTSHLHQM